MDFRLLGPFEAEHEGRPVTVGRRRERCLLGVLLLEANSPVPTERLLDLLWDNAPPDAARTALQTHISRLRAGIDPDGDGALGIKLLRSGDGYLAQIDPERVDALRFRDVVQRAQRVEPPGERALMLRRALGLWRGALLSDVASEGMRHRLGAAWAELRLTALASALEAELAEGRHRELIGELTALAAEHPYREQFTAMLMLALYRSGRQAEALQAYTRLDRRLRDDLGLDPGDEVRRLLQRILTADSELLRAAGQAATDSGHGLGTTSASTSTSVSAPGPAPAPASTATPAALPAGPRQLPAAISHFVGRAAEIKELTSLLDEAAFASATVVISAISGMAGVGKTALAVQWAHGAEDRFPDGQLYVNLRGFEPDARPMAPGEAIRGFLDALGVPAAQIPIGLDAQQARYRSLTAGRRMLIVLDNAHDAAQIRPLLPSGPGCLTLVTSRDRLTGLVAAEGARPVLLGSLSAAEARELLARRLGSEAVGREPAAVRALIQLCAGLPLALNIAAALAQTRPGQSLADLAADLGRGEAPLDALATGDPLTDLRSVFAGSYRYLDPAAARLLRLLALHPGPDIPVAAAAALAEQTEPDARQALATLTRAHLLTETAAGRFALHDLLRAYALDLARELEPEDEQKGARTRLFGWHLHAAAAADRALKYGDRRGEPDPSCRPARTPRFADDEEAAAWFTAEHPNIVAVVHAAADQGLDVIAWQLAAFTWNHFFRNRHLEDWLATHRAALSCAERAQDPDGQTRILNLLGLCHRNRGEMRDAIECYERSLSRSREAGNERRTYVVLDNLAVAYSAVGRHEDALRCLNEALTLVERFDDRSGLATLLNNLGELYRQLRRMDEAIATLERGRAVARELGDPIECYILTTLEQAHLSIGRHEQAAHYCRAALDLLNATIADHRLHVCLRADLGMALWAGGDRAAARETWRATLALCEELGLNAAAQVRALLESDDPVIAPINFDG